MLSDACGYFQTLPGASGCFEPNNLKMLLDLMRLFFFEDPLGFRHPSELQRRWFNDPQRSFQLEHWMAQSIRDPFKDR